MAPQLTTWCGFNLKHGTIIIGVIQSILAFMAMILAAAYAEHPQELVSMADSSIVPDYTILRFILIFISVAAAVQCLLSILIIFGAETNRPTLFVPWLIFNPVAIAFYIISIFVAIMHHGGDDKIIFIVGHLALGAIVFLIASYKVMAVYSYYKHMKSLNF